MTKKCRSSNWGWGINVITLNHVLLKDFGTEDFATVTSLMVLGGIMVAVVFLFFCVFMTLNQDRHGKLLNFVVIRLVKASVATATSVMVPGGTMVVVVILSHDLEPEQA